MDNKRDPYIDWEDFHKKRRLILIQLGLAFVIQVIILLAYYFKEKQVVLAFPMVLGLLLTGASIFQVLAWKGDH